MYDYNSTRKPIVLKEYGRNIQQLVEALSAIKDKDQRTAYAQGILKVMATLDANNKRSIENIQKRWDDLFIMADYQLDIDSPYPVPEKGRVNKPFKRPDYTQQPLKSRNYGRNIEQLIQQAIQIEDPQKQEKAVLEIVRLMKSFSNEWNNDAIVAHLKHMSNNKLVVDVEKIKTQKVLANNHRRTNNKRRKSS